MVVEEKKKEKKTKGISETDRESAEEIEGLAMEKGESSVCVWCASDDRDVERLKTKDIII